MTSRQNPEPHPGTRQPNAAGALARYLLAWLAGTATVVVLVTLALDSGTRVTDLEAAAKRAGCRLEPAAERHAGTHGALEAAVRSRKVVVRYRVTLSARDTAAILDLVRGLSRLAIAAPGNSSTHYPVVAENERERLGCPSADRRAARALERFIVRSGEER